MPRVLLLACAAAAALLPFSATADAKKPRKGPAGAAFYAGTGGKKHGDLIWWRKETGVNALKHAGSNRLVLYRSQGVGKKVAVSGSVTVPKGRAPKGGWPVITWAHGTTGLADICAPTIDGTHEIYIHPLLETWLKRGWAVVRTDYEGLGTPGVHPYLIGRSEGQGVLDIVRAARQLDPRIGRKLVISGHSQGGQAALWAASLEPKYTPELKLRGVDAFAPASHLSEQVPFVTALHSPNTSLSVLAMEVSRGLSIGDPSLNIPSYLSDYGASHFGLVDQRCGAGLAQDDAFGNQAPADLFKPYADLSPVAAALDKLDDPENLSIKTAVRIDQGEADTTVSPGFTKQTVDAYTGRGTKVTYQTYPGATHGSVTTVGITPATKWIAQRLR